jgi:hypothetical protein
MRVRRIKAAANEVSSGPGEAEKVAEAPGGMVEKMAWYSERSVINWIARSGSRPTLRRKQWQKVRQLDMQTLHHFRELFTYTLSSNFGNKGVLLNVETLYWDNSSFQYLYNWVFRCFLNFWDDVETKSACESDTSKDAQGVVLECFLRW